jgi:hypothetical protein
MKLLLILALTPLLLLAGGDKKRKGGGSFMAPQLDVTGIVIRRTTENTLELDGRVQNCSNKDLRKIVLRFKVLASAEEVVATQLGALEEPVLKPGDEAEFHWRMRPHARAVAVLVEATAGGAEIIVGKPGPYVIE